MFTGKVTLPQISLDLAEVSGGGSCPSQFEGTTPDGRPVYIRYRSGLLSVEIGKPGDAPGDPTDWEKIYEVSFGPWLHGDIVMEQISELTGITINGRRLALSESEFRYQKRDFNLRDFTGRTLYWDKWVYSSPVGMETFISKVKETVPEAALFDAPGHFDKGVVSRGIFTVVVNWRANARRCVGDRAYLVVPPAGLDPTRQIAFKGEGAYLDFMETFPVRLQLPCVWNSRGGAAPDKDYNADWHEFYDKDFVFARGSGKIGAEFPAERDDCRRFMETVDRIFNLSFATGADVIDLETGAKIAEDAKTNPYSIDLADWCSKSDRRFIGFAEHPIEGKKAALRPRIAPAT